MINGIINVYKESGFTSHDVVAKLRGIVKQKKIGHTGTLDPEAQGVLPVCLGRATKVCDLLTDKNKTYRAELLLGRVTDTQDTTGQTLEEYQVNVTEEQVRSCIQSFLGQQEQVPPMYSALKVNGKKLYELARNGIEVERKPRSITIHEIVIESIDLPVVTISVNCSKGTYIRTLCHDIGKKLGCGGCMQSLLRTKVGPFLIEDSIKLEEIETYFQSERIEEIVMPVDSVFDHLRRIQILTETEFPVSNGNPFNIHGIIETDLSPADEEAFRVYKIDGTFLAIYKWRKDKSLFWPVKMFWQREQI